MAQCSERDRIIIEWRESVLNFSDHVKRLAECTGKQDGFMDQFYKTDLTRQQSDETRRRLENHHDECGC
jgi:hypothetical protein